MNKVYAVEGYERGPGTTLYNKFFHNKEDALAHKIEKEQEENSVDWFAVVEYEVY